MGNDKPSYVALINQTINTINKAKNITGSMKQQAIRFYHWLGEYLPDVDRETVLKYREYEALLREKGILQW